MIDRLSEPINREIGQQLNSSLYQPKKGNKVLPRFLLIILGIVLVILFIEGVLLAVMKNRNKSREVESPKKAGISQEKIIPTPTEIESIRGGKKIILVKGKVSIFDVNNQKIDLILEDNTTKTIEIDDKTIFVYVEIGEKQISSPQPKTTDISTFWKGLKKDDRLNCSCYKDSNLAAFITKDITD